MTAGICCGRWHECKEHHTRLVHQQTAKVLFKSDERMVHVERDKVTMRFHCPRCEKSYPDPKTLRKHCRGQLVDCRLRNNGRKQSKQGMAHRHRSRSRSPDDTSAHSSDESHVSRDTGAMASTSTRPVRRGGTHTTRTQRALVRGYWEDEYTVHQITEYMNLTRRDTWHAIKNQSGDNLDEDEDYRNGTIGDVINVENLLLDIEPQGKASIKGEEEDIEEVDEKVDMDIQSDNDELEYVDVEMLGIQPIGPGSRGAAQRNQQHPQVSPVVTSPSQAVDPVRAPTSLKTNTNVKDDPQFPVPTTPLSTPDFARRAAGSNTPRDAAQSSHNNTGTSSSSTASSENGTARLDRQISPIQAFLGQLKRPLSHLTGAFTDFGVSTEEDLDVLSVLKDQWVLLQTFLCDTKKATYFEWMILKAGLELRAAWQTSCK